MLRYLAYGKRYFEIKPHPIESRLNWEFYLVFEGECAPILAENNRPRLQKSKLWVFPPECAHGWIGKDCVVGVFHFSSVHHALRKLVSGQNFLQRSLDPAQLQQLYTLIKKLTPHYEKPSRLSVFYEEEALAILSALASEATSNNPIDTIHKLSYEKVHRCIEYFREQLPNRLKIQELAKKESISTAHLRRLFLNVLGESPSVVFQRIILDYAAHLLSTTSEKLEEISWKCGFSGPSEFSRAFKKHYKSPPALWRAYVLPPYQAPVYDPQKGFLLKQANDPLILRFKRYKIKKLK